MRCLRPIKIFNQSRFLVENNRDQLVLTCNCGKCANCQRNKFAEWSFRAFKHFEHCVEQGGYMLFDTLTYSDEFLPHFRDFEEFKNLPMLKNHSCFNRQHIKKAMARLRRRLAKRGYGSRCFDYFLTSEYGNDHVYVDDKGHVRKATLRPHYHVLFYVKKPIPPLVFSQFVGETWKYGRTDGLPFKSVKYVMSNVFDEVSPIARRKVNYVAKYVMKHSGYSKMLHDRVMSTLYNMVGFDLDFLRTDAGRKLKQKLVRLVDSFHNQSQFFGLSALDGVDERELFECGYFKMPNGKPNMFNKVPISSYFLRKIAYDKVILHDDYECWTVRLDKKYLIDLRKARMKRNAVNQLKADVINHNIEVLRDASDELLTRLVEYRYDYQGRQFGANDELLEIGTRFNRAKWFVYASSADKAHFGVRFVSDRYLGYKDNYNSPAGATIIPLKKFVEANVISEKSAKRFTGFDGKLSLIDDAVAMTADDRQLQYDHLQHLQDVLSGYFAQ